MERRCVWGLENLLGEDALARIGPKGHKKKQTILVSNVIVGSPGVSI